jgi:two-component system sporulation sensor kinase A
MRIRFNDIQWLTDLSPDPQILIRHGVILYLNQAAIGLLGVENAKEVIGLSVERFIAPECLIQAREMFDRLTMQQGECEQLEQKWIRRDGKLLYLEVRGTVVLHDDEPALSLMCRNISERRKMEISLRESEHRYRNLLRKLPEGVVIHSDGIIVYANEAACKIFRAESENDLLGREILDFIDSAQQEAFKRRISRVKEGRTETEYIAYSLRCLDGETREVEVSSAEVYEWAGEIVVQTLIRDVTERNLQEQFLRQSDKLSAIGQLAAGVAHEIRNPLTTLIGFTRILPEKPERVREYCAIMYEELIRIQDIVNEFMGLSRPEQSRFRLHEINQLITDLIPIIQAAAILNNVDIRTQLDPNLPRLLVDGNQMKQVFLNIMKNAVEAMPDGGTLTVVTRMAQERVHIQFTDTGIGIPEEKIPRIGEPFFTTKETGSGLGVMVSYRIIQAHEGRMYFVSRVGIGTTVHIELPIRTAMPVNK